MRKECRAQIERAIFWGFDVSHLDSHMGTLQLRPDFFDVYLELAVDFGLPLRMAGASGERAIGFPFRRARGRGGRRVPRPLRVHARRLAAGAIERALFDLRPGVTEVYVHPAVDTDELRVVAPRLGARVEDHAFVTSRPVAAAT